MRDSSKVKCQEGKENNDKGMMGRNESRRQKKAKREKEEKNKLLKLGSKSQSQPEGQMTTNQPTDS